MKAVAVFPGSREVRLIDHPEPLISAPGEVKLRVLEVGVCGTDRDLCAFRFGASPAASDHFVLGHESLAEVVEVGDCVTSVRTGDLAVAGVRKPCEDRDCLPCRSGRQDFCGSGRYRERGILRLHGCMTESIVDEDRYVYRVPRRLRNVAVLIEPLTIAEKAFLGLQAIDSRLPWDKGERRAVVLGAGPIGLLGAMLFRRAGFDTWVYSRERASDPRAAIAEAIGTHYVSSQDVVAGELVRCAGDIDVVYEAMGAPQTAFDVLQCLGANGVFVFTGVPSPDQSLALDLHQLLLHMIVRNQVIIGTVNAGPDAFQAAIRDLATFEERWPKALASIITRRYPIEAFRDAIFGPGIKNVVVL